MELQPWRELLGKIIADHPERVRIATALGINAATLVRWANGETNPRLQNLHALLKFLPAKYRDQMSELILQEFPEFLPAVEDTEQDVLAGKIPSDFYASVLDAVTMTREEQRFFTISNRILSQALGQLDPNNLGMALSIAQCVPPLPGQKVRSMREVVGRGTPPWQSTLSQGALFLGIESLAGYALAKGRVYVAENRSDQLGFYTVRWEEWEESAVACPIMREGRYAGCLVASSTQPGYFLLYRQALLERYAQLLTLAFEPEDFYDQQDIHLLPMPSHEVQFERATNFRMRLSETILEASRGGRMMDLKQAERLVWQQLEEELLNSLVPSSE
jgi:transcriptional regulator with XRE-family HTH domain